VLFDGKDLSKWKNGDADAKWKVENGYFEVVAKTGTLETRDTFRTGRAVAHRVRDAAARGQ
jgi:hypothetical protein